METRQTLKDFLTSIGSAATSISLPIDSGPDGIVNSGDDLGIEPNTGRKLLDVKSGESLLGDYLSRVTTKNSYPISPGIHDAVSPQRGAALPPAETSSATSVFADSRVAENAASLNRSNSMRFDASGHPIRSIVDKLGGGTAPDGDTLLSSTIAADASSDAITGQTEAVVGSFAALKKYNKFSPTSSPSNYAKDDFKNSITPSEFENTRQTRFQIGKGEYSTETSEISAEITQKDLSNIARSMLLKAAGWDTSIIPAGAENPNTAFDAVSADTLGRFPEFTRDNLGVVDAFKASDSYGFPSNPDGTSFLADRGSILTKNYDEAVYTKTRGSQYTADQQFGESPTSDNRIQSLQAGLSMIGLAALIDKKLVNIAQIVKDLQVTNDTVLRGPYYLGRSTKSDLDSKTRALVRSFMFETGIYSYEKCVSEGLYACFGYNTETDRVEMPTDNASTSNIATTYGNLVKRIARDLDKPYYDSPMGLSQGFWRSVAESALRIIKDIRQTTQNNDGADYVRCLLQMKDSLVVKVMKVFASIGYQRLTIQGITTVELESGGQAKNPFDIDGYTNAPGTRQMKSRDGEMLSKSSLSWRNSALPSAFILPLEAMAAALDADYMFDSDRGSNPIKGMLGSTLYDKTYVKSTTNSGNIPSIVAKSLENRLGAEYLPFYFRDLRTNEIIAFHGFLDTYSDSFAAAYSGDKGFGRADPVRNYTNTTRTISFSFQIVATSKEDFDEMWFKINKLVTLVYPQYTKGRAVSSNDTGTIIGSALEQTINFEQPFSQLVGGTPVVRIRIGDILKSNYTRSNLGRLFGVGNDTFGAKSIIDKSNGTPAERMLKEGSNAVNIARNASLGNARLDVALLPFLIYAGSPMELTKLSSYVQGIGGASGAALAGLDAVFTSATNFLVNGFVNPFIYDDRSNRFKKSSSRFDVLDDPLKIKTSKFIDTALTESGLVAKGLLKPRSTPYQVTKSGITKNLRLLRPVFVKIKETSSERTGPVYQITIDDITTGEDIAGSTCQVSAADLYVDTGSMVDITSFPGFLLSLGLITNISGIASNALGNAATFGLQQLTGLAGSSAPVDIPLADLFGSLGRTFISPYNNPITRAFEDRMGEGMAGVVTSLNFAWLDNATTWETDWNSRAPRTCKVTIGFSPIHDIAPGIDANGFNRAPVYNVGQIMHETFGHQNADGGAASRFFYKEGGAVAESSTQPSIQQKAK
jgi:hypothetical protein